MVSVVTATKNADLDGTVIQPRDGKAFPKDSFDWQFCSPLVVPKLRELHRAGSVSWRTFLLLQTRQ